MSGQGEGFLSRWSRRKSGVLEPGPGAADPQPRRPDPAEPAPPNRVVPAGAPARARDDGPGPGATTAPAPADAAPLPTLDDVAALTRSSDYSRFVQPGVEPGVRNAAMKKLFADPHFNVMDGLDTYIDDYGQPDPIPPSMLRLMNQAASLGLFDEDAGPPAAPGPRVESPAPAQACTDGDTLAPVAQSGPVPSSVPTPAPASCDDDADLRLQPDDAPRRRGPEPGPGA